MATIQASDVLPVRSRVSWGAILAGAVTALALYMILLALGLALGLSLTNRMNDRSLGIATGIWTLVSMLAALFCGGCVASRATVGENKTEAALEGLIVWAVFFAGLAWMTTGMINTGLNAIMGAARTASAAQGGEGLSENTLRALGFSDEEINNIRDRVARARERTANAGDEARELAQDPRTTAAAWWTFTGIILSLAASVLGALFGAGPNLVITALRVRAAAVTTEPTPAGRETVNR